MYDRITQLPIDEFIFPFSSTNNRHRQWAVLSYVTGFWGAPPPTFNCLQEVWIEFAAEEVERGIKKLRRQPNEGPPANEPPQTGYEVTHNPPSKAKSASSDAPSTKLADETRQILGKRKRQAKADDDANQAPSPPIKVGPLEKDKRKGDNVSDQADDLSVTIYNRSQRCSSDIVHLSDLSHMPRASDVPERTSFKRSFITGTRPGPCRRRDHRFPACTRSWNTQTELKLESLTRPSTLSCVYIERQVILYIITARILVGCRLPTTAISMV